MEPKLIWPEAPHRKRHYRFNWLFLITALILLGTYVGYARYEDYNQIDMLERKQLANQASVIEKIWCCR